MQSDPPSRAPYQLVLQLLDQGYGGLEHDNASVMYSGPVCRRRVGCGAFAVDHEYLHQWNVRRLRPRDYVPYRYDKPVVSEGLWFAEGVTSCFDLFLPLLGLLQSSRLAGGPGGRSSHVLLNPGTQLQSLADSSREAWVRLYKQTPANARSQVSYYRLGTAIAFCRDVGLVRRITGSHPAAALGTVGSTWSRLWKA